MWSSRTWRIYHNGYGCLKKVHHWWIAFFKELVGLLEGSILHGRHHRYVGLREAKAPTCVKMTRTHQRRE